MLRGKWPAIMQHWKTHTFVIVSSTHNTQSMNIVVTTCSYLWLCCWHCMMCCGYKHQFCWWLLYADTYCLIFCSFVASTYCLNSCILIVFYIMSIFCSNNCVFFYVWGFNIVVCKCSKSLKFMQHCCLLMNW